jgi:hypothetical protein
MQTPLPSPQLVLDARMSCTSWIPADPEACARLLPPALRPAEGGAVHLSQYVVDRAEQTTGLGAHSLACLGLDVGGYFAPDGAMPARFFTHSVGSSAAMREYARDRCVPHTVGETTVAVADGVMTATTHDGGTPILRVRARVGSAPETIAAGHMRYVTRVRGRLVSGLYPYVRRLASPYEVLSIEFLEPDHPVYALRPAAPLLLVPGACFYAPSDTFVYPGGEWDMGPAEDEEPSAEVSDRIFLGLDLTPAR